MNTRPASRFHVVPPAPPRLDPRRLLSLRLVPLRLAALSLALLLGPLLLGSCGGGGGGHEPCVAPCVESGFAGVLDWEDPLGGSGGVGAGADGAGGVGAGGADGQFRKALVIVKFADGSELGRALTDDERGMVTIRPGPTYQGALLVEIHGQPGATYFEEGKNSYVPFETGRIQRAVIPSIRRNIGITPFSEAGYQLALSCHGGFGPPSVCGLGAPAIGGSATVPAPQVIDAANGHVAEILNQQLPASLKVDDVARLPFIVNDSTAANEIPMTPRGRYGAANIAFSKQAAMYNTASPTPTLLAVEQLSRDLLDGKLDGRNGAESAGAASQRTYDPQTLTSELSAALAQQTTRYGQPDVIATLPALTAFGNTRYDSYYFNATLEPDGATSTIAIATESPGGTRTPGQKNTYVDASQRGFMLYANMGSGSLFIKTDALDSSGSILAVGDNRHGELGDGTTQDTGPTGFKTINLPAVLTHAAGGIAHTVVRLADGSVYAWGDNTHGQLGQGVGPGALAGSTGPVRVNLPAGAVAVAASNQASFALLEDSSVYSWGAAWGFGTLGDNTANGERLSPAPVLSTSGPLSGVVQIAARDNDAMALKADGSIWTWGAFSAQAPEHSMITGVVPGNVLATQLQGIPASTGGIRKVLTEQGLFVALLAGSGTDGEDLDGAVYTWGVHWDITAGQVLSDRQPRRILNLPAIRDLMPGGFQGYGQRPGDRLTAMGIDYDGGLWKIRGRVAESYNPAEPTAQRRPPSHTGRPNCDGCHVVRPRALPTVPTSGRTCTIPGDILKLLNKQSRCENCHNDAPGARPPLACVPPSTLPDRPAPIAAPILPDRCTLTAGHPRFQAGTPCASCHNSVIRAPLTCSPEEPPLASASGTVATITSANDDLEPVQGMVGNGGFTNDTTPTLAGTLTRGGAPAPLAAGEAVRIYRDNGILLGEAAAPVGATSWQFVTPMLPAGASYTFTAKVGGADAAEGAASSPFRLVISSGGPERLASIQSVDGKGIDPVSQAPVFTANGSPTLSGTIEGGSLAAGESLQLIRTGQAPRLVCGQGCTNWSIQDSLPADGQYQYQAQVVGANGAAGALGNVAVVVLDRVAPAAQLTLSVSADSPAGNIRLSTDPVPNGAGIHDPTPTIKVGVSGAAANDAVEVSVSSDGGASYTSLVALQPIANGTAAISIEHASGRDLRLTGANRDEPPPSDAPVAVIYRARLIDLAGNLGSTATSSHQIGFYGCDDLKNAGATLPTGGRVPTHADVGAAPENCAFCHSRRNDTVQQLPRTTMNSGYRYWCTFSANKVVLPPFDATATSLLSPFLKKN